MKCQSGDCVRCVNCYHSLHRSDGIQDCVEILSLQTRASSSGNVNPEGRNHVLFSAKHQFRLNAN
ncbi:unnamed protein product, partial [Nesidiocoris tenuis]